MTDLSLGLGETLQSAPFNIFLMSVLTSMYDPRGPTLAAVEARKILCNEEELSDVREDAKKEEEHLYPVIPISPV